jgi:hypothetical protein
MAMQSGVMKLKNISQSSPLVVFAPSGFHQAEAKAVTLHASEDRGGAEVTIKLAGLHTVSGRVTSAEDHHGLNSGTMKLEDALDKEFSRTAAVAANGDFRVTFVPAGTYNLVVEDAADTEPSKKELTDSIKVAVDEPLRSYDGGGQSVIVGNDDVTAVTVEVVPAKSVKKDLDSEE